MANAKFKDILKQIKKYNRIIIHGHIRPDGDCVGSQFGLQKLIQTNFKIYKEISKNHYSWSY